MEEELTYVTVTFKTTNDISLHEKPNDPETVYEEVKTEERACAKNAAIPANERKEGEERRKAKEKKKAPACTLLHLVAAGLGIICVILASAVIALSIHFNTAMLEQYREIINLTAQNQQLWTEKSDLERQTKGLTREKDGLNWTMGVILEYENFPVNAHCPQKVCKPCLDGWVLFQSNCYLFTSSNHYLRRWQGSRDECRKMKADLVVIESQEEQEFINNHTQDYGYENDGYWIGLSNSDMMDTWMWVDGSNFAVMYWKPQNVGRRALCAVTLPRADPLANWHKTQCDVGNRRICETRALIKPKEESATLSN